MLAGIERGLIRAGPERHRWSPEGGSSCMAGKSAVQLVDVRLVEFKRIDEAFFQDYAKIHERLERMLDKEPRPLSEETVSIVADELIAWLAGQAAKNVPNDRLSQYLRVGLGHLCSQMIVVPHNLPVEEAAIRAYAELQRRGWDLATYDPEVAAQALRRVSSIEAARARSKSKKPSSAGKAAGVKKKVIGNPKVAATKAVVKAASAKKEAHMALEKKAAAKKPAAKKAVAKKPAKKAAAKKPAAKKAVAKKPVKKAAAKKPAAKKAVAKKPAVKPAEPKPAPAFSPIEEKKPDLF